MEVLNPITSVHGRVLVERAADPAGLLVGFHGYAQVAEDMLEEIRRIPGAGRWTLVSIQALHPFYTRGDSKVVASWMTRQDRELAIADNIGYVERACTSAQLPVVFVGFSQGTAMAYRAALRTSCSAAGIVALAGDIPPDVKEDGLAWPRVLIGVGDREEWYAGEKLETDLAFLTAGGIAHEVVRFAGGHEWTDQFRQSVGGFLADVIGR